VTAGTLVHFGLFQDGLYHARRVSATMRMEKSIYTDEYAAFLGLLRETRKAASLTQVQLAKRIRQSQSFVAKVEVGQRRLDVIQLRTILHVLGTTLPAFVSDLEGRLKDNRKRR